GISLAIITNKARENLIQCLAQLRSKGVKVVFDSNYRARLWSSVSLAQDAMKEVLQHTDIALLTLDDEHQLWGDDSVSGCVERYADYPLSELVLKRGAEDTVMVVGGHQFQVPVPPVDQVIDTTGAGDTFNAGYLAARLQGQEPVAAAQQGNRCAGVVIRHRGGVLDKTLFNTELKKC